MASTRRKAGKTDSYRDRGVSSLRGAVGPTRNDNGIQGAVLVGEKRLSLGGFGAEREHALDFPRD